MQIEIRRTAAAALAVTLALAAAPLVAAETAKGTVNVNSATAAELERLPGVGPALAARIVAHREQNGSFQKAEDLLLVRGIGEKSFERLKPYVGVSGATTLTEKVRLPRAPKSTEKPQG